MQIVSTGSTQIGFYKEINHLKRDGEIEVDKFLDAIREGAWKDQVIKIRSIEDDTQRKLEKQKLPSVTISGLFKNRTGSVKEKYSGLIAIDLDNLPDPEATKEILKWDSYVHSIFTSVSGNGLCVIFRIDNNKHRESFISIAKYLFEKYSLVADSSCVDPARIRYVSWDPVLIRRDCFLFDKLIAVEKKSQSADIPFIQSDFDRIIKQIEDDQINICEDYVHWRNIGFALSDQLGEEGRPFFHAISKQSKKYNPFICDQQYTDCINAQGQREIKIGTFFFYCKQTGIQIQSAETKKVLKAIISGKKSGLTPKVIGKNLSEIEKINYPEAILEALFLIAKQGGDDQDLVGDLDDYFKRGFNLRRNEITGRAENSGEMITDEQLNGIQLRIRQVIPKMSKEMIVDYVSSDFVPSYNPIKDYFGGLQYDASEDWIDKLSSHVVCVNEDKEFWKTQFKKALVRSIPCGFGLEVNRFLMVLYGPKQNTGKTTFIRFLCPWGNKRYYTESSIGGNVKDLTLRLGENFLYNIEELEGLKKDAINSFKAMISQKDIKERRPYDKFEVWKPRICNFWASTNDREFLHDIENTRYLIFRVENVEWDYSKKLDINKVWAQAYHLYQTGFDYSLTNEDKEKQVNRNEGYRTVKVEEELLQLTFRLPRFDETGTFLSASEIAQKLMSRYDRMHIYSTTIGKAMSKVFGIKSENKTDSGNKLRGYWLVEIQDTGERNSVVSDKMPVQLRF